MPLDTHQRPFKFTTSLYRALPNESHLIPLFSLLSLRYKNSDLFCYGFSLTSATFPSNKILGGAQWIKQKNHILLCAEASKELQETPVMKALEFLAVLFNNQPILCSIFIRVFSVYTSVYTHQCLSNSNCMNHLGNLLKYRLIQEAWSGPRWPVFLTSSQIVLLLAIGPWTIGVTASPVSLAVG